MTAGEPAPRAAADAAAGVPAVAVPAVAVPAVADMAPEASAARSARRPHHPPVRRTWFLATGAYRAYALREASSVVVGLFVLNLVIGLVSAHRGVDAFTRWVELQRSPAVVALTVVALAMAVVHAITWFRATPAVIRVRRGRRHLDRRWVVLAHYLLLAAFAVVVLLWLGRS
ncbi:hypothetical protein MHY85_13250 [Cellulomonas sp. ACRRI]|uniref:hypothetical protein n=1 Tax=Cellulomonas sp. ACRRI TaxID=2918188 RepID=UPI001EF23577|nr:hypothetical protein [Cellulomonas sp. ACRRI]MCG7286937.1 hypothetical protein [Cellulomonas sp. ACRRI]